MTLQRKFLIKINYILTVIKYLRKWTYPTLTTFCTQGYVMLTIMLTGICCATSKNLVQATIHENVY